MAEMSRLSISESHSQFAPELDDEGLVTTAPPGSRSGMARDITANFFVAASSWFDSLAFLGHS